MKACVIGIAFIGPGVAGWDELRSVLLGEAPWPDGELELAAPEILAPRERRRTSTPLRLALSAAVNACRAADVSYDQVTPVFGSAFGDGHVCDSILNSLTGPERLVSPTQFHNSVHNAAAGYWSIGTGNRHASISLAAGGETFGACLLRAMSAVTFEHQPTLLVVSDHPMPGLLGTLCEITHPMAVGLVLVPPDTPKPSIASLEILGAANEPVTRPGDLALSAYFDGVSTGRALPMLSAIANASSTPEDVTVAAGGNGFMVKARVSG